MGLENKKTLIPPFVILLLLFLTLLSGCIDPHCSSLPTTTLIGGWHENTALRNSGIQLFGLEKWCGSTYEIGGRYPAILSVNTIRTIMLTSEEELTQQVHNTIINTFNTTMILQKNRTGIRTNQQNHETQYIIYDAYDTIKQEQIKIIGEVWNCPISGTSILCIGIAYLTNHDISNETVLTQWYRIIGDPQGAIDIQSVSLGLLYQVRCH